MRLNCQRVIRVVGLFVLIALLLLPSLALAEVDITDKVEIIKGRMISDRRTGDALIDISVRNISETALNSPIRVVADDISDSSVTVGNADGTTSDGKPFIDYAADLSPGEASESKRWVFTNPNRVRFSYGLAVFNNINGITEVDASDVGANLVGAEYQDTYGNTITCYIGKKSSIAELEITEGYDYGIELPPEYIFTTNKFIKINYPAEYEDGRTLIKINYSTPPDRVIVYDNAAGEFKLAPFINNSDEGFVKIKTDIQGGSVGVSLVNID